MDKFVVTSAPFVRSSNDSNKMFLFACAVLVVPAAYGIMFFGINALLTILVSVVCSFLSEAFYNLIDNKKFVAKSTSYLVTGMLVGLTMPVKMPLYIVAFSTVFAVFVVKLVFGGMGRNTFNPAIAGRCLAGMMATKFGSELYEFVLKGETLVSLSSGGTNTISNLLLGNAMGGIGTTCIIVILLSMGFLIYSDVIDWKIPTFSIVTYFVVAVLLDGVENGILNMLSGSFIFVAVFMMTDPNTSPNTFIGKLVYSLLFGGLSALVWHFGYLGENTVFVVALFVNVFVPFMDKYFVVRQKALGGVRNAYKN